MAKLTRAEKRHINRARHQAARRNPQLLIRGRSVRVTKFYDKRQFRPVFTREWPDEDRIRARSLQQARRIERAYGYSNPVVRIRTRTGSRVRFYARHR